MHVSLDQRTPYGFSRLPVGKAVFLSNLYPLFSFLWFSSRFPWSSLSFVGCRESIDGRLWAGLLVAFAARGLRSISIFLSRTAGSSVQLIVGDYVRAKTRGISLTSILMSLVLSELTLRSKRTAVVANARVFACMSLCQRGSRALSYNPFRLSLVVAISVDIPRQSHLI